MKRLLAQGGAVSGKPSLAIAREGLECGTTRGLCVVCARATRAAKSSHQVCSAWGPETVVHMKRLPACRRDPAAHLWSRM